MGTIPWLLFVKLCQGADEALDYELTALLI